MELYGVSARQTGNEYNTQTGASSSENVSGSAFSALLKQAQTRVGGNGSGALPFFMNVLSQSAQTNPIEHNAQNRNEAKELTREDAGRDDRALCDDDRPRETEKVERKDSRDDAGTEDTRARPSDETRETASRDTDASDTDTTDAAADSNENSASDTGAETQDTASDATDAGKTDAADSGAQTHSDASQAEQTDEMVNIAQNMGAGVDPSLTNNNGFNEIKANVETQNVTTEVNLNAGDNANTGLNPGLENFANRFKGAENQNMTQNMHDMGANNTNSEQNAPVTEKQAAEIARLIDNQTKVSVKVDRGAREGVIAPKTTADLVSGLVNAEDGMQKTTGRLFGEASGAANRFQTASQNTATQAQNGQNGQQANTNAMATQVNAQLTQTQQTVQAKGGESFSQVLKGVSGPGTASGSSATASTTAATATDPSAAANPAQAAKGAEQTAKTAQAKAPQTAHQAEKPELVDQVKVDIAKAMKQGTDKITINLKPRELGSIQVKMEMSSEGHLKASITASRAETLDMLQKDARGLEKALTDAGLKADSGSLNFSLRGGEQNSNQMANQGHTQSSDVPLFADDDISLTDIPVEMLAERDIISDTKVNVRI